MPDWTIDDVAQFHDILGVLPFIVMLICAFIGIVVMPTINRLKRGKK